MGRSTWAWRVFAKFSTSGNNILPLRLPVRLPNSKLKLSEHLLRSRMSSLSRWRKRVLQEFRTQMRNFPKTKTRESTNTEKCVGFLMCVYIYRQWHVLSVALSSQSGLPKTVILCKYSFWQSDVTLYPVMKLLITADLVDGFSLPRNKIEIMLKLTFAHAAFTYLTKGV